MAENCLLKPNLLLPGVLMIIFALISDNAVRADVNFKSRPTTVKTFENDSLLLPCYSSTGKAKIWKQHSLRVGNFLIIKKFIVHSFHFSKWIPLLYRGEKIYFFEDDESEKNMFLYDENFVLSMTKGI